MWVFVPAACVCVCVCVRTWMHKRLHVLQRDEMFSFLLHVSTHVCVMWNQFPSPYLTHLTEGYRIKSAVHQKSQSRAVPSRQTHLHTYLYNGLRSALDPCHPHHPFLASVSLALLSFPPTPPRCAALPLPLLSCFKSSSFPLSMIVPVPPLPSLALLLSFTPAHSPLHSPLSPYVCSDEWQVSPPDANSVVGRRLR